jgi:hypothetical protein
MTVSDKDWNLLIDSDVNLLSLKIGMLVGWPVEQDDVIDLSLNSLFIHKDTFFSCKGYDEEYVNQHCGDRVFINYFKNNFAYEKWDGILNYNRGGRTVVFTKDVDITTYDDKNMVLYSSEALQSKHQEITCMIADRYNNKTFANKKTLCFPWTKVW